MPAAINQKKTRRHSTKLDLVPLYGARHDRMGQMIGGSSMRRARTLAAGFLLLMAGLTAGCAHLEFPAEDGGLVYFEPVPMFFVTTNGECVTTASVVSIPGARKVVKLHSGYGSSDLSVALSGGIIQSVGQKSDPKVSETLSAVTAGVAALAPLADGEKVACQPRAELYAIENGRPKGPPISFKPKTISPGAAE